MALMAEFFISRSCAAVAGRMCLRDRVVLWRSGAKATSPFIVMVMLSEGTHLRGTSTDEALSRCPPWSGAVKQACRRISLSADSRTLDP